jgi:two-component system CheB/CheR fusion protein
MVREYLDELKQSYRVQVFATDIDAESIEKARAGTYPESIAADVSAERLVRFFNHDQEGNSYHISKSIRDLVVFAKQDALKDPPFSRLDLISCRNMLIYLSAEAQKKILSIFHYALNLNGYLLLGSSETIGDFMGLYAAVDKKWKIYQRKGGVVAHPTIAQYTPTRPTDGEGRGGQASFRGESPNKAGARNLEEQLMLEVYVPVSVLCNAEFDILYIHGHTGKYLEHASGEASLNLLKMAREGLRIELTAAVRKALTQQTPVRFEGVQVKSNGDTWLVNIIVHPVKKPESAKSLLLVIFEDVTPGIRPVAEETGTPISDPEQRLVTLEKELRTKEEYLQAIIEELETANEELQSTNEELQSSNEELQSTNEELETSKEELQSVNEELITVNTELQKKIEELSQTNNDMNNLLASTNIGTLFVDHQLRIQRFTPATTRIINLISTDIRRPVSDIVSRLMGYDNLVQDTQTVLDTLIPKDIEVQTREGQWYQMRIQPYRTLENVIEGAVLTFVEITEMKHMRQALRKSEECIRVALKHTPIIVAMTDRDLRYVWVYDPHPDFDKTRVIGKRDDEIAQNDGTHKLVALKEQVVKTGVGTRSEIVFPLPDGALTYDIIAEPLRDEGGQVIGVTTAAKDITTAKRGEETPPETG